VDVKEKRLVALWQVFNWSNKTQEVQDIK
jgi:hypothetical protein